MNTFVLDGAHFTRDGIDPDFFGSVLTYVQPRVQSVRWEPQNGSLTVEYTGTEAEFSEMIADVRLRIGKSVTARDPTCFFTHVAQSTPNTDTWEHLTSTNQARDVTGGFVSYRGFFLYLVQRLDEILTGLATSRLTADPVHFPSIISLSNAVRSGAVEHNPHQLFFVSTPKEGVDNIEGLQKDAADNSELRRYLAPVQCCLKTSACQPLYPMLEGEDFPDTRCFTMLGTCTRNESKRAARFERLSQFQMREIVCVGDEQSCTSFCEFSLDLFQQIIVDFDLNADVIQATDGFFVSNYDQLRLMQLIGNEKAELRVLIPHSGERIAVGSFNHHRFFFSRRFGFTIQGQLASSACVGFGLERLAYGIMSRYGSDESAVRSRLEAFGNRWS